MLAGNASHRTILQPSVTLAAERGYRALNDPTPKPQNPGSIGSPGGTRRPRDGPFSRNMRICRYSSVRNRL